MFWIKHRKAILWVLYILFFVHAIIWYLCGWQKIGQFGFGEIFFTLKTGIVTAGTIFVLVVFIHALFFGGIFCGWFCHWGVTQDVAAWIMEKCGIKPVMRHLNSKLIPWVWFIILLTQVVLFWYFNGFPTSLSIDLAHTEVWAGNPKLIFSICMTTLISGFILIFLFGERAFCRSICTFRLWFSWFDKIAPYKIRRIKECETCSHECSKSCFMDIDVAKEVKINGVINNNECVKCFKCMGACPHSILRASFKKSDFEKNEKISQPTALFNLTASIIQACMAVIILCLAGFKIGGNMSLSIGFMLGFVLIRLWHTRTINLFEFLTITFCSIGLYFCSGYGENIPKLLTENMTSLLIGLLAIALFIVFAKYINYKKGFVFLDEKLSDCKISKILLFIIITIAIFLGSIEIQASFFIEKAMAAAKRKDWKTYAENIEKWGDYYNDRRTIFFELGKVELLYLKQYDKSLEFFKKSLDISYKESVAIIIINTYFKENLPLHANKLINYLISKGHDSLRLRKLLIESERKLKERERLIHIRKK